MDRWAVPALRNLIGARITPGTYEAGAVLAQSRIPLVKGTQSFIKAKMNWLCHYLDIETEYVQGLGQVIPKRQEQDKLNALLCMNHVGEWGDD